MTYEDVKQQLRAMSIGQHGEGATRAEIRDAERRLCVTLPDAYKAFLQDLGWGTFAHLGLYGLGADVPSRVELVRITLEERDDFHPLTPDHLIPIVNDGGGNLYCLDTSRLVDGECPIVFWDHELGEDQAPDDYAPGFIAWLLEELDLAG